MPLNWRSGTLCTAFHSAQSTMATSHIKGFEGQVTDGLVKPHIITRLRELTLCLICGVSDNLVELTVCQHRVCLECFGKLKRTGGTPKNLAKVTCPFCRRSSTPARWNPNKLHCRLTADLRDILETCDVKLLSTSTQTSSKFSSIVGSTNTDIGLTYGNTDEEDLWRLAGFIREFNKEYHIYPCKLRPYQEPNVPGEVSNSRVMQTGRESPSIRLSFQINHHIPDVSFEYCRWLYIQQKQALIRIGNKHFGS